MNNEIIKKLALENGFSLKQQASGNMDLNAYVYDFAKAIADYAKNNEMTLDSPARVGAGIFQKGIKWSVVIGAAQRYFHFAQDTDWSQPRLELVRKLVSGDFVLIPTEPTENDAYYFVSALYRRLAKWTNTDIPRELSELNIDRKLLVSFFFVALGVFDQELTTELKKEREQNDRI